MKRSTIWGNRSVRYVVCALFWLAVWQTVSLFVPQILFASPWQTGVALIQSAMRGAFWRSIGRTLGMTALGFLIAFVLGNVLAAVCHRHKLLELLLMPAMQVMKSVPVTCFVAVALIWMRSENISLLVSAFVVMPVSFVSLRTGLNSMSRQLNEMTCVFRVPFWKRVRWVMLPQALPNVLAGCRMSIGMCWKASIAGEIIGLPQNTVGEQLYLAKLYLAVDALFAWTLVIIGISLLFEKVLVHLLQRIQRSVEVCDGDTA